MAHLTKTESFGNGPPALGKRTEGPAQVADGVGRGGKETQLNQDCYLRQKLKSSLISPAKPFNIYELVVRGPTEVIFNGWLDGRICN